MEQRSTLEMKVGAFIIAGVVLLVVFLFAIGDMATYFKPSYVLRVVFDSANGISQGSPVQYAGVEVGKIDGVRIVRFSDRERPQVELLVRLPRDVEVRTTDTASISTFGLLGEKYLEVMPGTGGGTILKPGEILFGKPPISTERIMERSHEVLMEFQRTLEGINSLVDDPEARVYLKEAILEARDATRNWKLLGERLNLAMSYTQSGQGSLGKLLFDDELYERAVALVDDLQANPWKLLVRPRKKKKQETTP